MLRAVSLLAAVVAVQGFGSLCPPSTEKFTGNLKAADPMPENFNVVFFGDQGIKDKSVQVLEKCKDMGMDALVVLGDFDYESDPESWMNMLDDVLGPDFPVFAAIGNHDFLAWERPNGYAKLLTERYARMNATQFCEGEIGVQMTCNWKGLLLVLSGVGTKAGEMDHIDYADQQLANYPAIWKVCNWHKNQRKYQTGGKISEVPMEMYEVCRKHGAIVATGHEHSYARTHLMSNFADFTVANTSQPLEMNYDYSFVFCSGLGGQSIREWQMGLNENEWWAACAASDNNVNSGPLFCTFNKDGNARDAECTFVDIDEQQFDYFTIHSNLPETETRGLVNTCSPSLVEMAVAASEGDMEIVGSSISTKGDVLSVSPNSRVILNFGRLPVEAEQKKLEGANIQVYSFAHPNVQPLMVIRGVFPTGVMTKASVEWSTEDDDFEKNTVWNSPDVAAIIDELIAGGAMDIMFSFVETGSSNIQFYSMDYSPCFAPSLALHLPMQC